MLIAGQKQCKATMGALHCALPDGHSRGNSPLTKPDEIAHRSRGGWQFVEKVLDSLGRMRELCSR